MYSSILQLITRNCHKKLRKLCGKTTKAHNILINRTFVSSSVLSASSPKTNPLFTQNDVKEFKALFPSIVKEFIEDDEHTEIVELREQFGKMINYVLPTSDFSKGLTTVAAYKMLEKEKKLTTENIALAKILGWIVEVNQDYVIVIDDIMNQSKTRRGVPCWHVVAKKDLKSLNDGLYLQNATFALLKTHFSKQSCYLNLLHLFQDIELKNTTGQAIHDLCVKDGKINMNAFNVNVYNAFAKFRSGYLMYYLPVASAMYMANLNDLELHKEAEKILLQIGQFSQISNDYYDGYVNMKIDEHDTHKGKLSWLVVRSLEKVTFKHRKVMEENLGKSDAQAKNILRDLYKVLGLDKDFFKYKEQSFKQIGNDIQNMSTKLPRELFIKIMESVYQQNYH